MNRLRSWLVLAGLVLAALFATLSVTSRASAHLGEEKVRFVGRKRPDVPKDGPRGRAKVDVAQGRVLTLEPGAEGLSATFTLQNVGDGPLEVYRVGFDVDDGAPRVPAGLGVRSNAPEAKPLAPGETRTYTVTWRTRETRATQLHGYLIVDSDGAAPGAATYDPPQTFAVAADRRPIFLRRTLTLAALAPLLVALFGAIAASRIGERRLQQIGAGIAAFGVVLALVPLALFSRLFGREDGAFGLQQVERGHLFGQVEYFLGLDGITAPVLPLVTLVLAVAIAAARAPRAGFRALLVCGGVLAASANFFVVSQSLALCAFALVVFAVAASWLMVRSADPHDALARGAALKSALAFGIGAIAFGAFVHFVSKGAFASRLVDGTIASVTYAIPEIAREAAHGHAPLESAGTLLGLPLARGALAVVLVALGAIAAAVPLHGWSAVLAKTSDASTAALVFCASSVVSGYGLVRFTAAFLPESSLALAPVFAGVAIVTLAAGAARALVEDDARALIGHLAVAGAGATLLAVSSFTPQGIQAALALTVTRALAVPLALLVAAAVAHRSGEVSLARTGGLTSAAPRLAFALFVGVAASALAPGSGGFWGLTLALVGFVGKAPWVAAGGALGLALTVMAVARVVRAIAAPAPDWWPKSPHLEPYGGVVPDLHRDELPWVGALTIVVLLLAIVPGFWLSMSDTAVQDIQRALSPQGPTQVS